MYFILHTLYYKYSVMTDVSQSRLWNYRSPYSDSTSVVATHQSFLYALMHFIRVYEELFHVDASVFSYFICILTLRLQRLFK